jgi:hypothetical protein
LTSIGNILVDGQGVDKAMLRSYLAAREIVSVKDPAFGAAGDGVTDDTTAIQAAVDAVTAGVLYFPRGVYLVTSTININLDAHHTDLLGEGWTSTFIHHRTAGRAAVYVHGSGYKTRSAQFYPRNGSWHTIDNISIGSTVGHGLEYYRAGLNSRMNDVWLFAAAATKSYLYGRGGPAILEASHMRFGAGNMASGNSTDTAAIALLTGLPAWARHAIDIQNDNNNLVTELHFSNCQCHYTLNDCVVLADNSAAGGSFFNITFNDCQFKPDRTYAAYNLKKVQANLVNCYSEGVSLAASMVKLSGGAVIRLVSCNGNNCGIEVDLGVAGTNELHIQGGEYYQLTTTGATGTVKILASDAVFQLAVNGPVIRGTNNYYRSGSNLIPIQPSNSWTPTLSIGGGNLKLARAEATFERIGRVVYVSAWMELPNSFGGLTGNVLIRGLPFTTENNNNAGRCVMLLQPVAQAPGLGSCIQAQTNRNSKEVTPSKVISGTVAQLTHADMAVNGQWRLAGFYFTAE